MYYFRLVFTFAFVIFLSLGALAPNLSSLEVRYAEGFSVIEGEGYRLLRVSRSWEKEDSASYYALLPRGSASNDVDKSASSVRRDVAQRVSPAAAEQLRIIRTPVQSCIMLSTTYLYPLVEIGRLETLVGVDSHDYVYSAEVRRRIGTGEVAEVGNGPTMDMEKIVSLSPEMVMATGVAGEWNSAGRLEKAGVPVVVNADYLEKDPLGRAEWIKFIALFFGEEERATDIFERTEKKYLRLKERVAAELSKESAHAPNASRDPNASRAPKVLLNRPIQGRWVLPGGASYMARFLEAAGADYIFSENSSTSSQVLDIESVFRRAAEADFWLHQYNWDDLSDVARTDPRLTELPVFRNKRLVNNDARVRNGGGNDFYESGPYRPEIVLADLVKIFHPRLLPDHRLRYYRYLP